MKFQNITGLVIPSSFDLGDWSMMTGALILGANLGRVAVFVLAGVAA